MCACIEYRYRSVSAILFNGVSLSLSAILFCVSIGIGIGDTIFDGIAIDYRRYF